MANLPPPPGAHTAQGEGGRVAAWWNGGGREGRKEVSNSFWGVTDCPFALVATNAIACPAPESPPTPQVLIFSSLPCCLFPSSPAALCNILCKRSFLWVVFFPPPFGLVYLANVYSKWRGGGKSHVANPRASGSLEQSPECLIMRGAKKQILQTAKGGWGQRESENEREKRWRRKGTHPRGGEPVHRRDRCPDQT